MKSPFRLVAANAQGDIWDVRGWTPAVRCGDHLRPVAAEELIPAPAGTRLQFLEGRLPLGWPKGSDLKDAPTALQGSLAVAAQLPSGYTRLALPAYRREDGPPYLPFFGYTAVVFREGKPWVTAYQSDSNPHWEPEQYGQTDLAQKVAEKRALHPGNRVLEQLQICALEYGCYNATNIFLNRWEGAVTVSPACNAECVGCISEQPEDKPPSPQQRFRFVPSLEEIVEVGLAHLRDEESIFSFGQGCEGEPLLQAKRIAESIRALRQATSLGTIHLNTNASLPKGMRQVVEAGLDSVRISLNSVQAQTYTQYYQPRGYTFADLLESAEIARQGGLKISLNYLHMPGWNDRESELEALIDFVRRYQVDMIQLRNLNIDPDMYLAAVPFPAGQALGMKELIRRLRQECPHLVLGNHTRTKSNYN